MSFHKLTKPRVCAGVKLGDASKKFGKKFASGSSVVKVSAVLQTCLGFHTDKVPSFYLDLLVSIRGFEYDA